MILSYSWTHSHSSTKVSNAWIRTGTDKALKQQALAPAPARKGKYCRGNKVRAFRRYSYSTIPHCKWRIYHRFFWWYKREISAEQTIHLILDVLGTMKVILYKLNRRAWYQSALSYRSIPQFSAV